MEQLPEQIQNNNEPIRRGRGRPPKPKAVDAAPAPKGRRGRPALTPEERAKRTAERNDKYYEENYTTILEKNRSAYYEKRRGANTRTYRKWKDRIGTE